METNTKNFPLLTGNQLKSLALIAMTCDHVGFLLFPQYEFLRWIGRLAFPIFAYMIAEAQNIRKTVCVIFWECSCLALFAKWGRDRFFSAF